MYIIAWKGAEGKVERRLSPHPGDKEHRLPSPILWEKGKRSIFERWGEGQTSKGLAVVKRLPVLSDARFYEMDRYECVEMEEMKLRLSEFSQNHHTFGVEILDKYIRGGISVI
jgi:hypothetical protein